jgi:hypothetical protein
MSDTIDRDPPFPTPIGAAPPEGIMAQAGLMSPDEP